MARIKKTIITGVTREQMEEAFGQYALADAEVQSITASMDQQFVAIREQHADRLAVLEEQKSKALEVMQVFATENREELFSKRKSMETAHGVIGFRTGTPKLKTKKGFTWAAVLELLRKFGRDYIRATEEIAKDKLLADRDSDECQQLMEDCGIIVAQDETFYVEPKKEAQNNQ
ncbi:MAG: host-nuclease inhibitor Gam family protein [Rikenellaceae bacterium]|nr:host-nuclease inhibitor Gam family protein [Rikenellaceae bacterium]